MRRGLALALVFLAITPAIVECRGKAAVKAGGESASAPPASAPNDLSVDSQNGQTNAEDEQMMGKSYKGRTSPDVLKGYYVMGVTVLLTLFFVLFFIHQAFFGSYAFGFIRGNGRGQESDVMIYGHWVDVISLGIAAFLAIVIKASDTIQVISFKSKFELPPVAHTPISQDEAYQKVKHFLADFTLGSYISYQRKQTYIIDSVANDGKRKDKDFAHWADLSEDDPHNPSSVPDSMRIVGRYFYMSEKTKKTQMGPGTQYACTKCEVPSYEDLLRLIYDFRWQSEREEQMLNALKLYPMNEHVFEGKKYSFNEMTKLTGDQDELMGQLEETLWKKLKGSWRNFRRYDYESNRIQFIASIFAGSESWVNVLVLIALLFESYYDFLAFTPLCEALTDANAAPIQGLRRYGPIVTSFHAIQHPPMAVLPTIFNAHRWECTERVDIMNVEGITCSLKCEPGYEPMNQLVQCVTYGGGGVQWSHLDQIKYLAGEQLHMPSCCVASDEASILANYTMVVNGTSAVDFSFDRDTGFAEICGPNETVELQLCVAPNGAARGLPLGGIENDEDRWCSLVCDAGLAAAQTTSTDNCARSDKFPLGWNEEWNAINKQLLNGTTVDKLQSRFSVTSGKIGPVSKLERQTYNAIMENAVRYFNATTGHVVGTLRFGQADANVRALASSNGTFMTRMVITNTHGITVGKWSVRTDIVRQLSDTVPATRMGALGMPKQASAATDEDVAATLPPAMRDVTAVTPRAQIPAGPARVLGGDAGPNTALGDRPTRVLGHAGGARV